MGQPGTARQRTQQLRDYFAQELPATDAEFCFRWLAACALVPVLRWPLTSALGNGLASADGRSPPDEDLFLILARLPWFRTGRMPAQLRHALAATLDWQDRHTARFVLVNAFNAALRGPDSSAWQYRFGLGGHLARLVSRLPESELADPLLANGLRGWRIGGPLASFAAFLWRLPTPARRWFAMPNIVAVSALLVLLGGSVAGLANIDGWLPPVHVPRPFTLGVANVWLTACDGPTAQWGRPSFRPRSPGLGTSVELKPVSTASGFQSAIVAADLSSAFTTHGGRLGTIWSLAGDGALTYPSGPRLDVPDLVRRQDGSIGERSALGQVNLFSGPWGGKPNGLGLALPPIEVTSQGVRVAAQIEGATIVLADATTMAPIARIGAAGSPLLGIGKTVDGDLAVIRCDPQGRVIGEAEGQAPMSAPEPEAVDVTTSRWMSKPFILQLDNVEFGDAASEVLNDLKSSITEREARQAQTGRSTLVIHLGTSIDRSQLGEDVTANDWDASIRQNVMRLARSDRVLKGASLTFEGPANYSAQERENVAGNCGSVCLHYTFEIRLTRRYPAGF